MIDSDGGIGGPIDNNSPPIRVLLPTSEASAAQRSVMSTTPDLGVLLNTGSVSNANAKYIGKPPFCSQEGCWDGMTWTPHGTGTSKSDKPSDTTAFNGTPLDPGLSGTKKNDKPASVIKPASNLFAPNSSRSVSQSAAVATTIGAESSASVKPSSKPPGKADKEKEIHDLVHNNIMAKYSEFREKHDGDENATFNEDGKSPIEDKDGIDARRIAAEATGEAMFDLTKKASNALSNDDKKAAGLIDQNGQAIEGADKRITGDEFIKTWDRGNAGTKEMCKQFVDNWFNKTDANGNKYMDKADFSNLMANLHAVADKKDYDFNKSSGGVDGQFSGKNIADVIRAAGSNRNSDEFKKLVNQMNDLHNSRGLDEYFINGNAKIGNSIFGNDNMPAYNQNPDKPITKSDSDSTNGTNEAPVQILPMAVNQKETE